MYPYGVGVAVKVSAHHVEILHVWVPAAPMQAKKKDVVRAPAQKVHQCSSKISVEDQQRRVSECWRFYDISTARVTAKTCLDVFSLSQEQVWSFSVLGDSIYEMRCLFVAVGLNARFRVLPHWDNMS